MSSPRDYDRTAYDFVTARDEPRSWVTDRRKVERIAYPSIRYQNFEGVHIKLDPQTRNGLRTCEHTIRMVARIPKPSVLVLRFQARDANTTVALMALGSLGFFAAAAEHISTSSITGTGNREV